MTPLQKITERIGRSGEVNDPEIPRPLLTLEEFFCGNNYAGSIGCNLIPTPEPQEFHELLRRIENRPDVAEVRVEITMFDDPEGWPFSDTVWIITSAKAERVAEWFPENWRPDDCWTGWNEDRTYEPCMVPPGTLPVACWWD